jgi:hypothetical protein
MPLYSQNFGFPSPQYYPYFSEAKFPDDFRKFYFSLALPKMESKERESRDVKRTEFLKNPMGDAPDSWKGVKKGNKDSHKGGVSGEKGKKKEYVRKTDLNAGLKNIRAGTKGEGGRPNDSWSFLKQTYRPKCDNRVFNDESSQNNIQNPHAEDTNQISPAKPSLEKTRTPESSTCKNLSQKAPSPPLNHYRKRKNSDSLEAEDRSLLRMDSGGGERNWKRVARGAAHVTTSRGSDMDVLEMREEDTAFAELCGTSDEVVEEAVATKKEEYSLPKSQFFTSPNRLN